MTSANGTVEVASEPSATVRKDMAGALPQLNVGHAAGRYVVVGTLGTGAMGTVYRAYDPQLQREVALKRLRPGAADERATARLLREARAMARLSHPNVVAVYDVVAEDDGVTLAMECVEGGTLSDWLEKPREPGAVLAVLRDAGLGLAAAHRAGLVHRDFKPGNVLMSTDGAVKVTDFGLVKVRGDAGPGSTETGNDEFSPEPDVDLTGAGTVIGTPRYMAPEQARGDIADARSDQYSFCVSLWRGLVGEAPFEGEENEALQAAKHRGPPALPRSARVSPRIAHAIERGLAVDPAQRWPDMDALLRELAPPGSSGLRWAAAGIVAVAGVAAASIVVAGEDHRPCADVGAALDAAWSDASRAEIHAAFEASRAEYAAKAWHRIEPELDAYARQWRTQREDACAAVHVRAEQTTAEMDLRVGCLDEGRRRFAAAIDVLEDADAAVVAHAFELVGDLPPLTRCGDIDALARYEPTAPPGVSASLLEELEGAASRARALLTAGRYAEAQTVAAAAWERSAAVDPHPLRARIGSLHAQALAERDEFGDAEAVFREALRNAIVSSAEDETAVIARTFAHHLQNQKRPDEALMLAELAASIGARPHARPDLAAGAASVLGQVYRGLGRWDEALEYDRRALELRTTRLGADHPDVAVSHNNMGLLLYDLDRPLEAIDHLEEALRIFRDHLGDEHPEVALARNNLAMVQERAGRLADAENNYREALRIRTDALGETHPVTLASLHNLGLVKMSKGEHEEAEQLIRRAANAWDEVLPRRHPHRAIGYNSLGLALRDLGRDAEAEEAFVTAVELGEAAFGEDHPQMCQLWNNLALQRSNRGDDANALELAQRSLALCEGKLGPEHRTTKSARDLLGRLRSPASPVP